MREAHRVRGSVAAARGCAAVYGHSPLTYHVVCEPASGSALSCDRLLRFWEIDRLAGGLSRCLVARAPRHYRVELSAVSKIGGHFLKEEWRVLEHFKGRLMNLVGRHVHIIVLNVTAALLCVL